MTPYEDTANKYLPFDVLTNIPAQVLQARDPGQTHREKDARLVHDAFLLMFLFTMPCLLPKQVRDAQIYGTANVFKGQISPFAGMTVPEWVADELRCNPAAEFWQVRFRRRETNGQALCAVLPQNLIRFSRSTLSSTVRSWLATTIPVRSSLTSAADPSARAS